MARCRRDMVVVRVGWSGWFRPWWERELDQALQERFFVGAISIAVGANSFAKQAAGLPCEITGAVALPIANEFAPTGFCPIEGVKARTSSPCRTGWSWPCRGQCRPG